LIGIRKKSKAKRKRQKSFGKVLQKTSLLGLAVGPGHEEALGVLGEAAIETTLAFIPGGGFVAPVVNLTTDGLPSVSRADPEVVIKEVASVFTKNIVKCIAKKVLSGAFF